MKQITGSTQVQDIGNKAPTLQCEEFQSPTTKCMNTDRGDYLKLLMQSV